MEKYFVDLIYEELKEEMQSYTDWLKFPDLLFAKQTFCFFLIIPFSYVMYYIKNQSYRHFYNIIMGLFFQFLLYGSDYFLSILIQTLLVYILVLIFERHCGWIVFLESMIYLWYHHIYRQIYGQDYFQAVVLIGYHVCKYTCFAFSYQDGFYNPYFMTRDRLSRRLDHLPKFIEYFSYIHYVGGSVEGPFYDFKEFVMWMNQIGPYTEIPQPIFAALKQLGKALLFYFPIIFIQPLIPYEYMATAQFGQQPWWYKIFYFNVSVIIERFENYYKWTISQSAYIASGLGFNGYDKEGNAKWDQFVLCYFPECDMTHNVSFVAACMDPTTRIWKDRYIKLRIFNEKEVKINWIKQHTRDFLSTAIMASWYGFYPGRLIAIFCRRWTVLLLYKFQNAWGTNKWLFDAIQATLTIPVYYTIRFIMNVMPFNFYQGSYYLRSWERTEPYLRYHYYIPLIYLFSMLFAFSITQWGQEKKWWKKKEDFRNQKIVTLAYVKAYTVRVEPYKWVHE